MTNNKNKELDNTLGIKKLSKTELAYMEVIWAKGNAGISSEDLYPLFKQARGTKTTIIHNIKEKGLIRVEHKGRHFWYYPRLSKQEYNELLMKYKLKRRLGSTSLEGVVAAFCGKKQLSQQEKNKLYQLLDNLENE